MTATLRLDLIIRTSQRKRDAQSPAQQRQQAEAICAQGGHEIVHVHDSGRSESGKTMERESLRAFRERHRAGLTDGVVVGYLDRLGRAPIEESMTFVRELVRDGGVLVAADWSADPIDLSDSNTEDMLVFRMQMNRSQWNKAAERYRLSQRNAIKAGKWIGPAPLGYEAQDGRLVPGEHAETVAQAFRVAGRDGLHAAVELLRAAFPQRRWDTDHVRRVLRSRAYLGEVHYGDYAPNLAAHDAIVTPAEWAAAQTEPQARRANGAYPLSHLVHCGACGGGLVGGLQSVNGKRYRRMRCSACAKTSISADRLEAYVRDALAAALGDRRFRDQFAPIGLAEAERALKAARDERSALTRKVRPSHPDFEAWLAQADAEVAAAQRTFQETSRLAHQSELLPEAAELADPDQFARGLRAITSVGRFVVAPGRGLVAERVSFLADHVARPLAA